MAGRMPFLTPLLMWLTGELKPRFIW